MREVVSASLGEVAEIRTWGVVAARVVPQQVLCRAGIACVVRPGGQNDAGGVPPGSHYRRPLSRCLVPQLPQDAPDLVKL